MKNTHNSNRKRSVVIAATSLSAFVLTAITIVFLAISCSKSGSNTSGTTSGTGGGTGTDPNTITITGMTFSPSTLTVKSGTVVTWKNNDAMTHTATSDNGTTFNTGNIAPGTSASYTTSATGTFPYHCSIHPGMTATLVVTP
jgi:plastocyanin